MRIVIMRIVLTLAGLSALMVFGAACGRIARSLLIE
jgi:hypothetical protein